MKKFSLRHLSFIWQHEIFYRRKRGMFVEKGTCMEENGPVS